MIYQLTLGGIVDVGSMAYLVSRTRAPCRHCAQITQLLAIALPPGHDMFMPGDDVGGEELAKGDWQSQGVNAVIFYVEYIPLSVQNRIHQLSACFRFESGSRSDGGYWANHCEHCGAAQDDEDLFNETGGAFTPFSVKSAVAIEVIDVYEPMEARCRGYSADPPFFEFMRRATGA